MKAHRPGDWVMISKAVLVDGVATVVDDGPATLLRPLRGGFWDVHFLDGRVKNSYDRRFVPKIKT